MTVKEKASTDILRNGDWYGYDRFENGKFVAGYLLDREQEPELREVAAFNCSNVAEAVGNVLADFCSRPKNENDGGQDRKFKFENGQFVNRVSGEPIPLDEPIVIFRARDQHSLNVLREYLAMVKDEHHQQAIRERMSEFADFARNHPDRMKEPGITHDVILYDEQS